MYTLISRLYRSRSSILILILLLCIQIPNTAQENLKPPVIQQIDQAEQELTVAPAQTIKGRIVAELSPKLWKKTFAIEPKQQTTMGIERLNITPELERIFDCYGLEKIWRTMPQLEQPVDKQTYTVVSYTEYVKRRFETQKRRPNSQPYEPPELTKMQSFFELKFPDDTDMIQLLDELLKVPGVLSAHTVKIPIPQY